MVKIKYPALYTDEFGCEQAEAYFCDKGIELEVRNCIFKNNNFNFDFYSNDSQKTRNLFHLKDKELIEYFIDIKIELLVTHNERKCYKEFLLRIERKKNYYSNSLSFSIGDELYMVSGYDLKELLRKIKNKLPKEYSLNDEHSNIFSTEHITIENKNKINYLKNNTEKLLDTLNRDILSFHTMKSRNDEKKVIETCTSNQFL